MEEQYWVLSRFYRALQLPAYNILTHCAECGEGKVQVYQVQYAVGGISILFFDLTPEVSDRNLEFEVHGNMRMHVSCTSRSETRSEISLSTDVGDVDVACRIAGQTILS